MARKGSHPTTSKRNRKQKVKEKYSKAREEAQLAGVIDTTPVGAVRDERVLPSSQDDQRFPGLDRLAIRQDGQGWSVPENVKRKVIEKAAEVLYERRTYLNKDGQEVEVPPDRGVEAQAARTLLTADERQYERDHPEAAGKAKGGVKVEVNNINVVDEMAALLRMAEEQRRCQAIEDKIKQEQSDDVRGSTGEDDSEAGRGLHGCQDGGDGPSVEQSRP